MADKTIGQLDEIVTAAPTDMLEIEQISSGLSKRITKANLVGGNITGGGTVATGGNNLTVSGPSTINGSLLGNMSGGGLVATGGFTLTVAAASTISGSHVGTVNGNISGGGTLATGGFTLTVGGASTINGSLVGNITGGGTLALGGFTFTVPATGTAALLAAAQTFSALKTFSAGINLGGSTLTTYNEAQTFTPTFADAASGGVVGTPTAALGYYTRIGNRVWVDIYFDNMPTAGMTASNALHIRNLPFTAINVANYRAIGTVWSSRMNFTGNHLSCMISGNNAVLTLHGHPNTGGGLYTTVLISDLGGGTTVDLALSISYLVQ